MSLLQQALEDERHRYVKSNPASAQFAREAEAVMPGGNTRSVLHFDPFPLRFQGSDGPYLIDVDGHRYLDLLGNYSAGLLGHRPVEVQEALMKTIEQGWSSGGMRPAEAELAKLVCDRFPSVEMVRFTNSGTEANLMAIAVAKHFTKRDGVVVFRHAYHGGLLYFGPGGEDLLVPHRWISCDYNNRSQINDAFESQGESIACVIVEPMLAASGCIPGDVEFLRMLESLTTSHGSLLIFDEVMTSRLSRSGAQGLYRIVPDLTTMGKYLAGGLSFGLFGGRADVMSLFDQKGRLSHGGTFNNNEFSIAAGLATLRDALTNNELHCVNQRGDKLRQMLDVSLGSLSSRMTVTGLGSLMTVHAVSSPVRSPDDLEQADQVLKEYFFLSMVNSGYYMARRGFIALSVELTDDHLARFASDVAAWAERAAALVDE